MAGLVDGANVPPLPASANIGVFKSLSNDVRVPRHAISDSIKLLPERRHGQRYKNTLAVHPQQNTFSTESPSAKH